MKGLNFYFSFIILISLTTAIVAGSAYLPGKDELTGTVLDADTGLRWLKCSLAEEAKADTTNSCSATKGAFTWEEAIDACENLDYAGITTWRLPNIRELQSIITLYYDRYPRINAAYFPNTDLSVYYSSTTFAGRSNDDASNSAYAWGVDFLFGNYNPYVKSQNYTDGFDGQKFYHRVRCVTGP